jgi:hypothetical protein
MRAILRFIEENLKLIVSGGSVTPDQLTSEIAYVKSSISLSVSFIQDINNYNDPKNFTLITGLLNSVENKVQLESYALALLAELQNDISSLVQAIITSLNNIDPTTFFMQILALSFIYQYSTLSLSSLSPNFLSDLENFSNTNSTTIGLIGTFLNSPTKVNANALIDEINGN